jgi:hypothetical protein
LRNGGALGLDLVFGGFEFFDLHACASLPEPGIGAAARCRVHAKALVSEQVSMETKVAERLTVEVNAQAEVSIRLAHRRDIGRARQLAMKLLAELESVVDQPELYGMVHDAQANPEDPAIEALRDMTNLVASLPARTKVLKDLADALRTLIGAEREAFGLNTEAGSDGRPLVIVKDYTGRGLRRWRYVWPSPSPCAKRERCDGQRAATHCRWIRTPRTKASRTTSTRWCTTASSSWIGR